MLNFRKISTLIILLGIIFGSNQSLALAAPPPPPAPDTSLPDTPPPPREEIDPALETAFLKSIQTITKSRTEVLAFVMFDVSIDHVAYADDGKTALLWLALSDPDTGEILAAEPGLAIAKLDGDQKALADGSLPWEFTLQSDTDWQTEFSALPDDLMNEDLKTRFAAPPDESKDVKTVYRGYKLPWAGGLGKRLTGSIGHFLIYNSCSEASCRYAYDFADGTMFPLLASRGGTVYDYKYDCENNLTYLPGTYTVCSNYLVLKDESTTPTTYQLYLHNAYESLPQELRRVGAKVVQGQYIGNVDDTGYSSGHHLHFMVHTNPYSYWGASVDVRFDDVAVNDGTPRTCYEASNWPVYGTGCADNSLYVSQNYGANPPSANLIIPAPGEEITDTTMLVGGIASDDLAVTKIEIMARGKDNTWRVISPAMTETTFLTEINMCNSGLPSGPIDIYARVFDYEGNQAPNYPGFRTILNNADCVNQAVTPACNPSDNQIAIFSDKEYKGNCKILGTGDFTSFSPVLNDDVESVLVGANVRALLFEGNSISAGRSLTLDGNDPNLEDDAVSLNQTSAIRVQNKSNLPSTPNVSIVLNDEGVTLTAAHSIVAKLTAYGATEVRATLTGPVNKTLGWTRQQSWSLGSLSAGNYTLQVWGRNSAGERSASSTFSILPGSLSTTGQVTAPYSFNFESGTQNWTENGLWWQGSITRDNNPNQVWVFNNGTDIKNDQIKGGDLTSPPIVIPGSGYYLRFDYLFDTEDFYTFWDQRWVQISVNGGPFENLMQLSYDPNRVWLTSPGINLSAYAGKTIQLRFYINVIDSINNGTYINRDGNTANYIGWFIDNVNISTQAPLTCQSSEPNDTILQAASFSQNNEVFSHICPNGDLDYFRFSGLKNEGISLNVDAMDFGSKLDPYLFLMDSNGKVLASNDDDETSDSRDSLIITRLPADGTYYAMIKAWNHPGVGDGDHFYILRLRKGDLTKPEISFLLPSSNLIPTQTFPITAQASDVHSAIAKVDFYYRDGNSTSAEWKLIGSDSVGTDGWSINFDPTQLTTVKNSMLFIEAWDTNGNKRGALLVIDGFGTGEPQSALNPLNPNQYTTLINLTWWANDPVSGIKSFDIQKQVGTNTFWEDVIQGLSGSLRQYTFFGALGTNYKFRMKAVDYNGVEEPYPLDNKAETSVLINTCSVDSFEANGDNQIGSAQTLAQRTYQSHNFCPTNDVDWIKFNVEAGKRYMVLAIADGKTASINMQVYRDGSIASDASSSSAAYGVSSTLFWDATTNETIYVRLQPTDSRLAGNDVKYRVWVGEPSQTFLPLTTR